MGLIVSNRSFASWCFLFPGSLSIPFIDRVILEMLYKRNFHNCYQYFYAMNSDESASKFVLVKRIVHAQFFAISLKCVSMVIVNEWNLFSISKFLFLG